MLTVSLKANHIADTGQEADSINIRLVRFRVTIADNLCSCIDVC
jgi:hypothetical protein